MKFLVFATDLLPLEGFPTSGIVLRTQGIIDGLRDNNHQVITSCPQSVVNDFLSSQNASKVSPEIKEDLKRYSFTPENQLDIILETTPDVLIFGHWPALMIKEKLNIPIIIDLAGPHLLERLYQGETGHENVTHAKINCLSKADYFIVSGPSQKEYFKPYIQRSGHTNINDKFIDMPMPLFRESAPQKQPRTLKNQDCNDFPKIFFGGVFLPWQNPKWSLEGIVSLMNKYEKGKLILVGGPHPNYKINTHSYEKLFEDLQKETRVEVNGLLPYSEFLEKMAEADIAMNLMEWNFERQLAVAIRSTSYLESGLPLIIDDYSDISKMVAAYDAGWCVTHGSHESLEKVFKEIIDSPKIVREKSLNSLRLSKEVFNTKSLTKKIIDKVDEFNFSNSKIDSLDINLEFVDRSDLSLNSFSNKNPLTQYFLCRQNGLYKIKFKVSTENIGTKRETFIARVGCIGDFKESYLAAANLTSIETEILEEKEIEVGFESDSTWQSIHFKPQSQSQGKAYCLSLFPKDNNPKLESTLFSVRWNGLPLLPLTGDKTCTGNSLCLRTHILTPRGGGQ